jgi:hypothetical protein
MNVEFHSTEESIDPYRGFSMFQNDRESNRPARMRPDVLLPLVRAAMSRGEGPAAVLAWVRSHGHSARPNNWTSIDEARALALAGRLADTLTHNGGRGDPRTKQFGETFAAEFSSRG